MLTASDKAYRAGIVFGMTTDTQDASGEILTELPTDFSKETLEKTIKDFIGEIEQIPPMFSAIKKDGKKLYELARAGVTIEREKRKIKIFDIKLLEFDEKEYTAKIEVSCSKGTYIRTLVEDIGENLGCGAVLTVLTRTKACGYSIDQTITLEDLQQARNEDRIDDLITDVDTVFSHLERIDLSDELATRLINGARSRISKPDGDYRVYYQNRFYAVANVTDKKMSVVKLFVDKEN